MGHIASKSPRTRAKSVSSGALKVRDSDNIHDYYEITPTVLGQGSFSIVYLGIDKATNAQVAIKVVKIRGGAKPEATRNEIEILLTVQHENVIACLDVFETDDKLYLVMELVHGGELFDRVVSRDSYSEAEAKIVAKQLFNALEYLHGIGIVHRDLKPENILLSNENDVGPIKISDFGLSKFYSKEMMSTACGSPGYLAPEILKAKGYTAAVDMWSTGVVIYIILCGYPPFYSANEGELFEIILEGRFSFHSPYWDSISEAAKDLISKCLVVDPQKRLTAKQALKHPWFTQAETPKAAIPFPKEMKAKLVHHTSERRSKSTSLPS